MLVMKWNHNNSRCLDDGGSLRRCESSFSAAFLTRSAAGSRHVLEAITHSETGHVFEGDFLAVNKSSLYSKPDHWQISLSPLISAPASSPLLLFLFQIMSRSWTHKILTFEFFISCFVLRRKAPSDWDSIRQTKPNSVFINTLGGQMSQQMCVRHRNQIFINSKSQLTSTEGDSVYGP